MDWNLSFLPDDHPTPSIIVSEEIVSSNIQSMQAYCDQHSLKLRPHTKTHKSKWMARQQLAAGAVGLTVAKVGEAEVMGEVCDDLMIAYPAIGKGRLARLAALASRIRLTVAVDSQAAVDQLQQVALEHSVRIGVVVDLEVGFHRTGVVDPERGIELSKYVVSRSNLDLRGVMCFPGHIPPNASEAHWAGYEASLSKVVNGLREQGIEAEIVSGGSTPTAKQSHKNAILTEIRPGTYIYNDLNEVRLGVCSLEEVAARVVATVVSTPEPNKIVVDAGSKTLSSDRNAGDPNAGFGYLPDFPNATVVRLSEEHGEIELSPLDLVGRDSLQVGDRIWIIPNHICVCINLQNEFYLYDGSTLRMMKVDARGMVS